MALLDDVRATCERLAPLGWGELLSGHRVDLTAGDLASELARPLADIDRDVSGFEDFAAGVRGGGGAR